MPLETGTYISDLVTSNPAPSDPLSNADDHMRLVKATIKATFPNFTAAAVSSTQAQLDAAVAASVTNGVGKLADAGAFFKTNTTDGFTNPAAGEIDLKLAGTLAARFVNSSGVLSLVLPGTLSVTGAITGPGAIPIGGMLMWLSDTLPTVGSWCWANGGVLSRTGNGAALWQLWGNTSPYGLGDGATTFNVINMQEVVPVGKSGMGGGSSPGLLPSIGGIKAVLNGLFGTDQAALSTTNLPPITVTGSVSISGDARVGVSTGFAGSGAVQALVVNGNGNQANNNTTAIPLDLSASFSGGSVGGSSTPFGIAQPSRAVNFIIRIG